MLFARFYSRCLTTVPLLPQLLVLSDGAAIATASSAMVGRKLLGFRLLKRRGDGCCAVDGKAAAAAVASDAGFSVLQFQGVKTNVLIRTRFGE